MDDSHNPIHTVASDQNVGPLFLGVDWAIFSLSTIAVLIRLFTRAWVTRNFGRDDAMMALTQMVTAVGKGFVVTEVSYGLGQHRSEVPIEHYRNFLKYYYLDTVQFFIALATCKISICLFLLRLSQFNKMRAVLYGLIGFLVFTTVVLDLLYALQCQPVHKVWDVETPGKCFSANLVMNINIVQGVFSFITDFICAAFPIVLLRNLNVSNQRKYVLCILMSLGVITGGVAIARVATAKEGKAYDLSWDSIAHSMTRIFEVNIGNIAACVPLFKPFGRWVRAKVSGQDPRELFYRKGSEESLRHEGWYNTRNFWRWRSKSNLRSKSAVEAMGPTPETLPAGVMRMKAMSVGNRSLLPPGVVMARSEPESTSSRHSRNSLGLPLQGVRATDYGDEKDIPPVPDIRVYEARRNLHGDHGEMFDAKDIVDNETVVAEKGMHY